MYFTFTWKDSSCANMQIPSFLAQKWTGNSSSINIISHPLRLSYKFQLRKFIFYHDILLIKQKNQGKNNMKTKKLFIYEKKILDWISPNTRDINNSTWTFWSVLSKLNTSPSVQVFNLSCNPSKNIWNKFTKPSNVGLSWNSMVFSIS